jgi:hypothetical protein
MGHILPSLQYNISELFSSNSGALTLSIGKQNANNIHSITIMIAMINRVLFFVFVMEIIDIKILHLYDFLKIFQACMKNYRVFVEIL